MDWSGMIINVIAIFAGLFIYIGIINTKWGKEHEDIQYAPMLVAIIAACLIGYLMKLLFGVL